MDDLLFILKYRSNPKSKEWWLHGHRRPRGTTPRSRSGGAVEISLVQGKEQQLCFGGAAVKRYPTSKVRQTQVRRRCCKTASKGRHTETIIRKLVNLITQTTALSNSMKLSHAMWGHPRWAGHGGEVWQNVVHWRREWQTTSVFLPWKPHEQYEKAKW